MSPRGSASMLVPRCRKVATIASDQNLPFKRVHAREQGEVIVILHPAVQQTEFGERFELFGDNGLLGIGPENRSREIEQCWILDFVGPGTMTSPKPISICIGIRALASVALNLTRTPS